MKLRVKALGVLCVLCGASFCFSLDREAFSITNYDLQLQIEPEQHRLGVRGKITLRNDTDIPQKIAVLQISSSLGWRSIKAGDRIIQFVTQPFTSDIDHTGQLSEAIVTLPQEVAPHATLDLNIAYEGLILLDATRLTRIGTPEDAAKNSDWDRIDKDFTAVRGAGYVAWYPIATDVANLSEDNSLFEVLARWRSREAGSKMHVRFGLIQESREPPPELLFDQPGCLATTEEISHAQNVDSECSFRMAPAVPTFVIADYLISHRSGIDVHYLRGHEASAERYANQAEKILPIITEWFGSSREKAQTADLPDAQAAPFESRALLLTPLADLDSTQAALASAHQLTHVAFASFRPWMSEGLAHFAQVLYVEQQKGRQAALDYMGAHRVAFKQPSSTAERSENEARGSLVNATSENLNRSKAMCVWWMLRDMIGDAALKKALASYEPEQDKDPSYMPRLIATQTPRDLEWFFDDWVYRDRGLPDFKVESAFSRKTLTNSFMLTVTVENLGTAGAEVPVIIKFAGGEVTKRLEVRANSKATIRVEIPAAPQEIRVNDGSVPESDMGNNIFKIEAPQS